MSRGRIQPPRFDCDGAAERRVKAHARPDAGARTYAGPHVGIGRFADPIVQVCRPPCRSIRGYPNPDAGSSRRAHFRTCAVRNRVAAACRVTYHPDSIAFADSNCLAGTKFSVQSDAHRDRNAESHSHRDRNAQSYAHRDRNRQSYAQRDRNRQSHAHRNRNRQSHAHRNRNAQSDAHL